MVCADMVWSDPEDEYFTAVLLLGVVQCVCVCVCVCVRVHVTVPRCVQTWCGQIQKMKTSLQCYSLVLCSVCVCGNNITVPCVQTSCSQIQTTRTSLQCYSLMLYSVCVYVCVCVRVNVTVP